MPHRAVNDLPQADWSPRMYDRLHGLASAYLRDERRQVTLQPTVLVHDVFLRMQDYDDAPRDRDRFLALAGVMMRRILVDHARRRAALKRGGAAVHVALVDAAGDEPLPPADLLALDAALTRLSRSYPRSARVVECRFFGGMTVAETARYLGLSARSVNLEWRFARSWLHCELEPDP